jgi:hypoxanthine phosphoribosyltransferase
MAGGGAAGGTGAVTTAAPAAELLIPDSALQARVEELGKELAEHLSGGKDPPVLVGVLKGSTLFLADLVRSMHMDLEVDFMSISAYGDSGGHSGVVRIIKDLERDIDGREVVIVEDIVDTGLTLNYLRSTLIQRGARSLMAVTLLDKVARRIVPVALELRGFEIPDVFVVGYGLDFQGRYRNLRDIFAVRDIARLANDPYLLVDGLFTPREEAEARPRSPVGTE